MIETLTSQSWPTRLIAGIKAAAPDRTLQQIAAQLEAMHERASRGGTRWRPSSVKHRLAPVGVSQAGCAPRTGITARQVNNWCRGRATLPPWAAALAVLLERHSPEAIAMLTEARTFAWHETRGVPPNATADATRLAMRRLAL